MKWRHQPADARSCILKIRTGIFVLLVLTGCEATVLADDQTQQPSRESGEIAAEELSYTAGKTLFRSDFAKDDLGGVPWKVNHGKWRILDGELDGATNAEENHEAALSLMLEVPQNLLVDIDFRLPADEDEAFTLCFIGGPGPHGRVHISRREFYLRMKAGDTGAASVIDYAPLELNTETWHHLSFLRHGDRLVATINDQHRIAGRHKKFTSPKKRISLGSETAGIRLDNISVRELSEVKAAPKLFSKRSYTLSEFWSMRETKYGLARQKGPKKDESP